MLCFDHGDRDRLGNMFPRRKDGVMKIRLSVLFVLGLVMAIGCVPQTPAEGPELSMECSTHEDCYFKALAHKCIHCTIERGGIVFKCQEAAKGVPGCIEWAHRQIKKECKDGRTGMGDLCGDPPPPPEPLPSTTEGRYFEALISQCMDGRRYRRDRCTVKVHRQIRKECAENPNGMGELCK